MEKSKLVSLIRERQSFLCVGLDSDIEKLPKQFSNSDKPQLEFNKSIIDATRDLCVSYKLNTAFYEARGAAGWEEMAATVEYIGKEHFIIADAKRGDIGNTCHQYAKAFFTDISFDAITIAPYMGYDSVSPFLEYKDKFSILLALTSNPSAANFQFLKVDESELYKKVLQTSSEWEGAEQLMYVVGATKAEHLKQIRAIIPDHFLLVPGVGKQGGSLKEVVENGINKDVGLLVNSSRGIIFASRGEDFAEAAHNAAKIIQTEMQSLLSNY